MAGAEVFRFGRGRDNDSSSSRESSPRPRQKRSFSPPSDDDTVMPAMADDDTPPPPDRPIIRQAVAFSSAPAPASINTYRVSLPSGPSISDQFLPGQEVPKPKKLSAKKAGSNKRTKRTEQFSGQTGRFRIQSYDPTPSDDPPLHHGNGPYSAIYRNTNTSVNRSGSSAAMSVGSFDGYPSTSTASVVSSSTLSERTVSPSNPNPKRSKSSNNKAKPVTSKRKASETRHKRSSTSVPSAVAGSSMSPTQNEVPPSEKLPLQIFPANMGSNDSTTAESQASTSASYYRRNYDSEDYGADIQEQASPDMRQSTPRENNYDMAKPTASSGDKATRRGTAGNTGTSSGNKSAKELPLRMVTVLITDLRSGYKDRQLAEVKVVLRPADDPELGFWADAKELSGKLQSSPARIDGPAKVYTMRGGFRQFFLRVSDRNVDEFVSANLCISPERTLDVAVERLLPPGTLPPPPNIPKELMMGDWSSDSEYADIPQHSGGVEHFTQDALPRNETDYRTRKRRLSPSFDDYDGYPEYDSRRRHASSSMARSGTYDMSNYPSPSATTSYHPTATSSAQRMSTDYGRKSLSNEGGFGYERPPPRLHPRMDRGYESPLSDDDPDEVDKVISQAVDNLINKDPGWTSFFKGKANEPRVGGYLMQYEFFQRMADKYVGQLAPFKSRNLIITKSHIISALRVEDGERFASDCSETLNLLRLYGKGGNRYEDSQVVEMINDTSTPAYGAKPIKRFLRLLREIDERWKKEHPQSSTSEKDHRGSTWDPEMDRRLSIEHIAG